MVRPASISISPAIPSARQCQALAQFLGNHICCRAASPRLDPTPWHLQVMSRRRM